MAVLSAAVTSNAATFTNLVTLHTFTTNDPTGDPYAAVVQGTDGLLYGTTYGYNDVGGVFKLDTSGSNFFLMHSFTYAEGEQPSAPLIQATNGVLYGTTSGGGPDNGGSIFTVNPSGSGFAVVHYFTFATNDGGNPVSALLQASDGALYGTSQYGGTGDASSGGDGVLFKLAVGATNITILHSFIPSEGIYPYAAVIEGTNGALYGTTLDGGMSNRGSIFRIDKDGSNCQVIHLFTGGTSDGYAPEASLLSASNGELYGTASAGGMYNHGVVFMLDYSGSNYAVIHHFGSVPHDGDSPLSPLVSAPDGALYSTTYFGGINSGIAFAINLDGTGYNIVVQFAGTNGATPNGLIVGSDGAIYGTCNGGGTYNRGTVFKLTGVVPQSNVLAGPISLGGTNWLVSGHGTAGSSYTVQFATDLFPPVIWMSLGRATGDVSGHWQITDPTNSLLRFYRTISP